MKSNNNPSMLLLLSIVFVTFSIVSVEARKHEHQTKKNKPHEHHHKGQGGSTGPATPAPPPHPTPSTTFNVLSFGAKGDGVSDDSKAFVAAWGAACSVKGSTVEIPSGYKLLINPITLEGRNCMPHLVLQIDGTLLAPSIGSPSWPQLQWINFKWVHNFTIQGTGIVDGQGFEWWKKEPVNSKPTALRFYCGLDVTVRNIKIINSPQCHLKFDSSSSIKVHNINISSPENSRNTDGIHLQNTKNVEIHDSTISCGDDCVSIQTGCSNVHVHHVHCGPGHGISIGGLGVNETAACVSNIVVNNISLQNTDSGVRIKTWPGGKGSVKNVSFSNIQVTNVKVPIVIDQNYCDKNKICKDQNRGAVAISGVKYVRIIGTFSEQPIRLNCSNETPCTDVDLTDILLNPPAGHKKKVKPDFCRNSYGKSKAPLIPLGLHCLRRDGGPVKRIAKSHENPKC